MIEYCAERGNVMSCTFYRYKGGFFSGDFWCDKKNCRVDEDTYHKYCRNYDYKYCPIFKKSDNSSMCYITTIVCDILSKEDNNEVLNNLRYFRDNVMQKDEKYFGLLKDYDNIGPILATLIENDKDKEVMANYLFTIIEKVSDRIKEEKYDNAVVIYEAMTLSLINYYNLKHLYNLNRDSDYDYEYFDAKASGHGKKKIK